MRRGRDVLGRIELIRVSDRVLAAAGELLPAHLRSLDAIHLATAQVLGSDLRRMVTYDERTANVGRISACQCSRPGDQRLDIGVGAAVPPTGMVACHTATACFSHGRTRLTPTMLRLVVHVPVA